MDEVSLRFLHWPNEISEGERVFAKLIELAINRPVRIELDLSKKVDIQIESVYHRPQIPSLVTRSYRYLASKTHTGINFGIEQFSTNQQPSSNARFSIFFTGENERPPYGKWDASLSFDMDSFGGKNAYCPLWWLTSSDLIMPTISPYLGKEITIDQMLSGRETDYESREKFCVAFIGKAYPFRMQAIAALSRIGKVDVYGGIARNSHKKAAQNKFDTAQEYKFVFAFENDLYPGYVTEKVPEAWATGAIPLYWGLDAHGCFNPNSLLNLAKYANLDEYVKHVGEIANSKTMWSEIARQPLILTRPSIQQVLDVLRTALAPLLNERRK